VLVFFIPLCPTEWIQHLVLFDKPPNAPNSLGSLSSSDAIASSSNASPSTRSGNSGYTRSRRSGNMTIARDRRSGNRTTTRNRQCSNDTDINGSSYNSRKETLILAEDQGADTGDESVVLDVLVIRGIIEWQFCTVFSVCQWRSGQLLDSFSLHWPSTRF
jgi:hypothetical protein